LSENYKIQFECEEFPDTDKNKFENLLPKKIEALKQLEELPASCFKYENKNGISTFTINKNVFEKKNKIDDVIKWTIVNGKIKLSDEKICNGLDGEESNGTLIIVILESPHREEFIKKIPASKKTGEGIFEMIKLIKKLKQIKNGKVIVMNRVSYQTSLARYYKTPDMHSALKNKILRIFWNNELVRENFSKRLQQYMALPFSEKIIINSNSANKDARLESIIKNEIGAAEYIRTSHPSRWGRFKIID